MGKLVIMFFRLFDRKFYFSPDLTEGLPIIKTVKFVCLIESNTFIVFVIGNFCF